MVLLLVAFYGLSVDTDIHHPCHWFVVAVVQSATKSCAQLFTDYSMPVFPVLISPGVCSNSCPLSRWCHPIISFSVTPFSSCPQSFPALGSFPMSWLFASGSQTIGASASASVFPMNIQDWFPLRLIGLISCSPRDSQESSPTPQFKSISSLALSLLYGPTLTSIHDCWKNQSFNYVDLCQQSNVSVF